MYMSGADPGFLLGGGALVSCSTSTAVNHIVFFFFLQNTRCIRKPQVISGGRVRTPRFKFYFPLVFGMVMYDNEFETKENKI